MTTTTTTYRSSAVRSSGANITRQDAAKLIALLQEIDLCCRVTAKLVADPDIQVQASSLREISLQRSENCFW
ncbi:MAG: hypothetical protein ACRDQU_17015 [Pseudonocardiaceae bacterium]